MIIALAKNCRGIFWVNIYKKQMILHKINGIINQLSEMGRNMEEKREEWKQKLRDAGFWKELFTHAIFIKNLQRKQLFV